MLKRNNIYSAYILGYSEIINGNLQGNENISMKDQKIESEKGIAFSVFH